MIIILIMKLEYNISKEQYELLAQAGICNGVGGEGSNIENLILMNLKAIPWYDEYYINLLLEDLRSLWREHDIQYFLQLWFYMSNFKFARKLYRLTNWWQGKRLLMAYFAFRILNSYGKQFYYK